jgi:hypothetical protein
LPDVGPSNLDANEGLEGIDGDAKLDFVGCHKEDKPHLEKDMSQQAMGTLIVWSSSTSLHIRQRVDDCPLQ